MKRSSRRLLLLLLVVAVLVVLAAWQWQRQRADDPGTLLDVSPQAVTRIELMRRGQPPRRFVMRDGHWVRTAPAPEQPADAARMRMLAALAATPVLQWRPAADYDLSRIGLDQPPLVVRLNGHELAYGTLAAFGPQRFVRVGPRVAIIAAQDSPRPPAAASSVR